MRLPKVFNYIPPEDKELNKGRIVKGICDHNERAIYINPDICDQERLITSVHEMLHYILPKAREQWVETKGVLIGNVLWRMGYRSKPSRKKKSETINSDGDYVI